MLEDFSAVTLTEQIMIQMGHVGGPSLPMFGDFCLVSGDIRIRGFLAEPEQRPILFQHHVQNTDQPVWFLATDIATGL